MDDVVSLVDEGLGNSAYLVDLGDGRALAVDASRDLRSLRTAVERRHLTVAYAADTHLHADFLSGAVQLAATDGARVLASATGGREFAHQGLRDGDQVEMGGLMLRAVATPGHTDEHLAFELLDGARTVGVFTGGSLLVGSAARTDLMSADRTEELARAQYHSLHRLAALDDDVAVWPTHGAGSFCSAPPGTARVSTIGRERETNSLLRAPDEDAFVAQLLESLGSFPPYFLHLGEVNRRGPTILDGSGAGALPALDAASVSLLRAGGAEVVDVRPVEDFAGGHVPGAVSIPLRPVFATWLGWLITPGRPLVIVRNHDQDLEEVVWQARKIGYDQLVGELLGGFEAWRSSEEPVSTIALVGPDEISGEHVLDVRQRDEFLSGHLPDARHLELGEVAARMPELPAGPTVVMCGHGERAMGAASLLARSGRMDVAVLASGPDDWARATNNRLMTR